MTTEPDLTVVIPMRNAGETIGTLTQDLLSIQGLELEVIAVDDVSTDDSVAQVEAFDDPRVRVLRSKEHHGAGAARNRGFEVARGTYTLFFDADDEILPLALVAAVGALDDTGADVAFLPYRYRRGHTTEFEGMNSFDQTVWSRYMGPSHHGSTRPSRLARLGDVPRLLGFSNYPWNKVIRTARYTHIGLRFGTSPVHNDIVGHWMTLLEARSLVLVNEPLCNHIVADGATNLTNRRSDVRLTLFDALDETYTYLEQHPALRNRYSHHYWDFVLRVAGWASERIDAEHAEEFNIRLQRHLLRMNMVDFARIRQRRDPGLASRIVRATVS